MDSGDKDTERMLMLYIHDYMRKNNMNEAAKIFAEEANLELKPVIDAPEGFLAEWWEVFWNKYFSIYSNIPGLEETTWDTSTLDMSFVMPGPGSFQETMTRTMLPNVSPIATSFGIMSQLLAGNTSHCNNKDTDTVMEPSATILIPTPGINRRCFEKSIMPNACSTSHQEQQTSMQSSLLVASRVASNQNSQGGSSSHMELTLQPGLKSVLTGSGNLNAGAFDFFKYYFRD